MNTPDSAALMRRLKADVRRKNEAERILTAAADYTWRRGPYDDVHSIARLIEAAFLDGADWAMNRADRHA